MGRSGLRCGRLYEQRRVHDVEHELDKPEGAYRIAVLGDSYIEALQLPIEEGFAQQLEPFLQRRLKGQRVEVINLRVSGIGPARYYRMLEVKGLRYKPDLVVMAVFPENDVWDSHPAYSDAVFKPFSAIRGAGTLKYLPPQTAGLDHDAWPLLRRSAFLQLVRKGIASWAMERWLAHLGFLAPAGGLSGSLDSNAIPLAGC